MVGTSQWGKTEIGIAKESLRMTPTQSDKDIRKNLHSAVCGICDTLEGMRMPSLMCSVAVSHSENCHFLFFRCRGRVNLNNHFTHFVLNSSETVIKGDTTAKMRGRTKRRDVLRDVYSDGQFKNYKSATAVG